MAAIPTPVMLVLSVTTTFITAETVPSGWILHRYTKKWGGGQVDISAHVCCGGGGSGGQVDISAYVG